MKKKCPLWPALYGVALVLFTAYVLLDTFVIPRGYAAVQDASQSSSQQSAATDLSSGYEGRHHGAASETSGAGSQGEDAQSNDTTAGSGTSTVTGSTYESDGVSITVSTSRYCDTTIYVAEVTLDDSTNLRTALANDTYGKNITQTTSAISQAHSAVLAINGDNYGSRNSGYVIRNGSLYRSSSAGAKQEDLVIYTDGTSAIIREGDITAQELLDSGAWQVFSFGPGLVEDGAIAVDAGDEVDKAMTSNPRTAIGYISPGRYLLVVADGRTGESTGLSLYELAEFMRSLGVTDAYNLDGGGSSTVYFNDAVINNPTTNGNTIKERKVSDIVYIGF